MPQFWLFKIICTLAFQLSHIVLNTVTFLIAGLKTWEKQAHTHTISILTTMPTIEKTTEIIVSLNSLQAWSSSHFYSSESIEYNQVAKHYVEKSCNYVVFRCKEIEYFPVIYL